MSQKHLPFRPTYHFTPPRGWMNDPNGLCYHKQRFHLFYQHNPYDIQWGHLSWGHAVSKDLLKWENWPLAISETAGEMAFSGSLVVDLQGCAPFSRKNTETLVACYTGFNKSNQRQYQNIAYSTDEGSTWKFYQGNPVLDIGETDFRDPKLFRMEGTAGWFMIVALPEKQAVRFYHSLDFIHWCFLSEFSASQNTGGKWECPDFFSLPAPGSAKNRLWVLKVDVMGIEVCYFVGNFDGKRFTPLRNAPQFLPEGPDFYAAQTFYNLPPHLEAPLWLGWLNNWDYADNLPADEWRGVMSLPRSLFLNGTAANPVLRQMPPRWFKDQFKPVISLERIQPEQLQTVLKKHLPLSWSLMCSMTVELNMESRSGKNFRLAFQFRDEQQVVCTLHLEGNNWHFTRSGPPLVKFQKSITFRTNHPILSGGAHSAESHGIIDNSIHENNAEPDRVYADQPQRTAVSLEIWLDWHTIEIFINGGERVISALIFPGSRKMRMDLEANGGTVFFRQFSICRPPARLKSN